MFDEGWHLQAQDKLNDGTLSAWTSFAHYETKERAESAAKVWREQDGVNVRVVERRYICAPA